MLLSEYSPIQRAEIVQAMLEDLGVLGTGIGRADGLREAPDAELRESLRWRLAEQRYSLLLTSDPRFEAANINIGALRSSDALIVLVEPGQVAIPDFQFTQRADPSQMRFMVRRCNKSLLAGQDPWGAFGWWVSANGYLGGKAPIALIDTNDEAQLPLLVESVTERVG